MVPGATEGIFCAVTAVVHPGDEVIVLDPVYDSYEPAVTLAGGRTVHVPLSPGEFTPVCRAQVALNVIDDHFGVVLARPNIVDPEQSDAFLAKHAHEMLCPRPRAVSW